MNSSKTNVTVVLAAYNEEENISKAIESIVNQTYQSWELIIVNDCSTDSTLKLIKQYNSHEKIKILCNSKNVGLAKSLNYAISVSNSDYIARMDADDICFPERLMTQMNFMRANPDIDVLGAGARYFDGKTTRIVTMPETNESIQAYIHKSSPFIHPSVIYKKSFIEKLNGYDENSLRAEDYDLWYRGLRDSIYHNLSEPLLDYNEAHKRIIRSTLDCSKVRLKYNPSKLSAIYWSLVQLAYLVKNRFF